jgi:hypothetical protein
MQMLDDREELYDEIDEEIEQEETVKAKKKDKIPEKSFAALIREYQREGYSVRESMEKAYRKMYPPPKLKIKTPKKKADKIGK